jgi:phosphoenolpyruvate synthase/pyruvate phosphate dikinase
MAALIQEMVSPVVSGVAFSKNPLTGLNEVVVEAVQGSGDLLVRKGVTPERWVFSRGQWLAQPEQPQIDRCLVEDVVAQTRTIAKAYGRPIDLEWVYDGHIVQEDIVGDIRIGQAVLKQQAIEWMKQDEEEAVRALLARIAA